MFRTILTRGQDLQASASSCSASYRLYITAKAGAHDEVIVTVVWVFLPVSEIPRKPISSSQDKIGNGAFILDPHTTSFEQIQLLIVAQPIFCIASILADKNGPVICALLKQG